MFVVVSMGRSLDTCRLFRQTSVLREEQVILLVNPPPPRSTS